MGLHLGSSQELRVNSNKTVVRFNIPSIISAVGGTKLISLDNYTLKDSNGLYLTAKEDK